VLWAASRPPLPLGVAARPQLGRIRGGQHYLDNGGLHLTALWQPSRRVRRTELFG
jgi:hypothetical protein